MSNSQDFLPKSGSKKTKKKFLGHASETRVFSFCMPHNTQKLSNTEKLSCGTVLHAYQFFLWEFNMGKMDEMWSVMINK